MTRESDKRLPTTYNRLLVQVRKLLHEAGEGARPTLDWLISEARERLDIVEELGREEAEKIGNYLKRDLEDAADYLSSPEANELGEWLKMDLELIEQEALELFASVADQTKLELMALQERARLASEYHTGEITGIGTLFCNNCSQTLHFNKTGHIPPCPQCGHTQFHRED
jgi:NADH pyrophosphatase NudC (nudix superfamily)